MSRKPGKIVEGMRFGRWTAITGQYRKEGRTWQVVVCSCDCGTIKEVNVESLRKGTSKSCGCLAREKLLESITTHGMSDTRQYWIWHNMRKRCDNPSNKDYKHYGGRGITYSEKWNTFSGFWEDMGEGYSERLTLDRIDVNGDYSKDNCRWVSSSYQRYNERPRKSNTSSRVGVFWDKRLNKWVASIKKDKKSYHLGVFKDFEDAVKAREDAEIELYGSIKFERHHTPRCYG